MSDSTFEMSPEEREELIKEFLAEAEEHLASLNGKLLQAEEAIKNDTEMADDDLDAMFRAAHTIKGTASFIGLPKIVTLTHEMETILQRVKNRELTLTLDIIDILFTVFDVLEALFTSLKENSEEGADIKDSVRKIKSILESSESQADVPGGKETIKNPEEEGKKEDRGKHAEESEKSVINLKYLEQYFVEMEQMVNDFDERMIAIERGEIQDSRRSINDLFRIMHTIKGSSGIVNAGEVGTVAHSMENIFSVFRDKGEFPDPEIISLLFKGIDTIKALLSELQQTQAIGMDVSLIVAEVNACYSRLVTDQERNAVSGETRESILLKNKKLVDINQLSDEQKQALRQALAEDRDIFKIFVTIDRGIPVKSIKSLLVKKKLQKKGGVISIKPTSEEIDQSEDKDAVIGVVFSSSVKEKDIRAVLLLDGVTVLSIEKSDKSIFKNLSREAENEQELSELSEKEEEKDPDPSEDQKTKWASLDISTIRVDAHKLDTLMNLSGELVMVKAQFARLVDLFGDDIAQKSVTSNLMNRIRFLDETTHSLGKISADIQSGVMQTRMIPVEGVFTRFKRIVRNISKDLGKDINLTITGEETELDKKIIDSLGDPLTHMIRNAVDHGIEEKEARRKSGKQEAGNISLKASHKGNSICIEVEDDGNGLDPEKLVQTALKKNLISKKKADGMTEKEKFDLLFLPGFSTAEKVTGLSGRGVGMDVVRGMITSVNGVVDIETEIGKGTNFILKIPLTLAIIQALLVLIADETYALPIEGVTEIVKVVTGEIYSIDGNPTVKIREHALSLVELETVIGLKGRDRSKAKEKTVVVITDGESQLGIVVDSLIGESEIVIKSLPDYFSDVWGVTGASILGDGRVALILDPSAIIKESK